MKTIVGVMGPGEKQATDFDLEIAYKAGKFIAANECALLCGGMSGVMEASARGAQDNDGLTIGIGSTGDKEDMNKYLDLSLCTAMGPGRNFMNIISSDILIFVSVGSPGTLSELAFAIQMKKPSIVINGSENLQIYISDFVDNQVVFVNSFDELEERMLSIQK